MKLDPEMQIASLEWKVKFLQARVDAFEGLVHGMIQRLSKKGDTETLRFMESFMEEELLRVRAEVAAQ